MTESQNEPVGSADPFAPENIGTVQVIVLMRIYDVLMAQLTETNPEAAKDLINLHVEGGIFGPIPSLNGTFVTNEVKEQEDSTPTGE